MIIKHDYYPLLLINEQNSFYTIKIFDDYKYCGNINIQNRDEWRQELFGLLDT